MELCQQYRLDTLAGFVLRPETVSKRFDDVISRDSDVSRAVVEHLRNCMKHARNGAVRRISFLEAPEPVKVPKEFVCAVDQVNDHLSADYRD
jgi:hypothetical protein